MRSRGPVKALNWNYGKLGQLSIKGTKLYDRVRVPRGVYTYVYELAISIYSLLGEKSGGLTTISFYDAFSFKSSV